MANEEIQNGHRADECPDRVNITSFMDSETQYMHGDCLDFAAQLDRELMLPCPGGCGFSSYGCQCFTD